MAQELIVKCFEIIEFLSKNKDHTLEEIYLKTKMSRSSVFRVLKSLEEINYVTKSKTKKGDVWKLDLKFLTLGHSILLNIDMRERIQGILTKLSDDTGESVQFGKMVNGKMIYIDRVENFRNVIKINFVDSLGYEFEVNETAAGMVLAAYLDKTDLDNLLKKVNFRKNTEYSITDKEQFRNFLQKVKKQGYAINNQGFALGVCGMAVPVFNFENKVVGAINITGHIFNITEDRIDSLVSRLIKSGEEASKLMGYMGD